MMEWRRGKWVLCGLSGPWGHCLDSEWMAPLGSGGGASHRGHCGLAYARSTIGG